MSSSNSLLLILDNKILDNKRGVVSAPNALTAHPARATKVTRGIEAGNGGMKNMDLAAKVDLIFDIIWNWTTRMSRQEGYNQYIYNKHLT